MFPTNVTFDRKIYIYTFNRILLVAVVVIESKTRNIYICNVHKKPLCHLIFYLSYGQTQNKKIYKRVLLLRLTLKWNRRQTKKISKDIIDLVNVLISYWKIYSMSADIFHIFICRFSHRNIRKDQFSNTSTNSI